MKIYFNSYSQKVDNSRNITCTPIKNNNQTSDIISKTNLANMPNYQYQVSFGAMNTNLENLYKAFGQGKGMPETYNRILSRMTSGAREAITNVYAHYRSIYAPLENCHSTEEIQKLFPVEFSKIQSALTRKSNNGSFISKVAQWGSLFKGESDSFLFPETKDNDLTVYLAKKLFLEAKTKDEIKTDFFNDINREILSEQDIQELMTTTRGTKIIPNSVFVQLGLQGKFEANGFRHSLLRSREDYVQKYGSVYFSKRKAAFDKSVEAVISTTNDKTVELPKRGSANYEKSQYAMFDAWNNSMDLKVAMSEFLTGKKSVDEMLMPDLMSIHTLKIKKDETQMQRNLMQEFWAKHPSLRGEFSNRCKDSFDKIEKAIDEGKFDELKKEIDTKRQSAFLELKELKEAREKEIFEQKRLAEEKLRIEKLNTDIRESIRKEVGEMRKFLAIPQNEIKHTTQFLSHTVKDGKVPEPEIAEVLYKGLKAVLHVASEQSFEEICKQKEINKNIEPYLREMLDELKEKTYNNLPKNLIEEILYDKCKNVNYALKFAYKKYLLFICNNSATNPKLKVRKNAMQEIINKILEDTEVKKDLTSEAQKKLLKAQAFKIAEIPVCDIEKIYKKHYNTGINKMLEIQIQ